MRAGSRILVATVLGLVSPLLSLGAASADAPLPLDPPKQAACLPLVAGTSGLAYVGPLVPSLDSLLGQRTGFGPVASPATTARLPERVVFKDQRATFSNDFAFALLDGRIYVRRAKVGKPLAGEKWHALKLPTCLSGKVTAISADQKLLLALGPDRQLYSNDMASGGPAAEGWTWRWGPPLWLGGGQKMYADVQRWATSGFDSYETFTDTSGRVQHPIGVATVYLLRDGGRRITYLDPWLPQDQSREVCTPRRGTLPLANLSASGSTAFVAGQRGELYTRLYDFDTSGANTIFGDYSWQVGRPAKDKRWQLPGPAWKKQPTPNGTITDRISIAKTGTDASNRLLVVEGRDAQGRVGRFEKQINAAEWTFVATGDALAGRRLPLASPAPYGAVDARRYAGTIGGRPAVVTNFGPECSPANLQVSFGSGVRLDLVLHSTDGMRQLVRARGLTDAPRQYNGAIEIPAATYAKLATLPPSVRTWISTNLSPGRFTTSPLAVTTTKLRSLSQCWSLTLNGQPARPDAPGLPDYGVLGSSLFEMFKDGRPPKFCL